jgi:hypothetical protein
MYHLTDLIGKVVTIKNINGDELMALMAGVNEEKTVLTLQDVKLIAVSDNQVVLLPYMFTATTHTLFVETKNIFAITQTMEDAAADYQTLIAEEKTVEDA